MPTLKCISIKAPRKRLFPFCAHIAFGLCIVSFTLLSACASSHYGPQDGAAPPSAKDNAGHPPDAVPKLEKYSRYGNPSSYAVNGKRYQVLQSTNGYDKTGKASWYGTKFHGRLTSSREPYDMYAMTAASPNLPIPSYVHVTNLDNGRSVVVKVNDRGPFKSDRIIDLSYAAAKKLGYINHGTAKVRVTGIDATNHKTILASKQKHENAVKLAAKGSEPQLKQPVQIAQNTHRPVYLQVGAFKAHEKAVSMSEKVSTLTSVNASVKTSHSEKGPIYLVNLGPIVDDNLSDKVRTVLAENGFEKPFEVGG